MKPILVEAVRTKTSLSEMTTAMVLGWKSAFGTTPKKESIGVLLSQWSLETGAGASCWCFNIGNYKSGDITLDYPDQQYYCELSGVWEIINGVRVVLPKSDPGSRFRAFLSLDDGVAFYLKSLRFKRYAASWEFVEAGSVEGFAHSLKMKRYYTAPEADYIKGMNLYFHQYMKSDWFEKAIASIDQYAPTLETHDEDMSTMPSVPIVWDADTKESPESSSAPEIKMTFWQKLKSLL
jgi:hypothetical protein